MVLDRLHYLRFTAKVGGKRVLMVEPMKAAA
jgi:hypothetical protein